MATITAKSQEGQVVVVFNKSNLSAKDIGFLEFACTSFSSLLKPGKEYSFAAFSKLIKSAYFLSGQIKKVLELLEKACFKRRFVVSYMACRNDGVSYNVNASVDAFTYDEAVDELMFLERHCSLSNIKLIGSENAFMQDRMQEKRTWVMLT